MKKTYTEEQIKYAKRLIIKEISLGKSLRKIIKNHKDIPRRDKIIEWLNPNHKNFDADFTVHYARAKEESADVDFDKIEEYIEMVKKGTISPRQGRVMMQGRMWMASRKRPKKYGNKVDLTTNGNEITSQVVVFQLPDNKRNEKND